MPELPEVETVRATLAEVLPGRTVDAITTDGSERFAPAADALGATITSVRRAGKYLLIGLGAPPDGQPGEAAEDAELVIHLGMSGQLLRAKGPKEPLIKHTHVVITFTQGGQLRYIDPRTFGELFVASPEELEHDVAELHHLGFDPLEDVMSWTTFGDRLTSKKTKLKPLLMDQKFIAGIGNIYADEILFNAGLRYDRSSESLTSQEVRRLYRAMIETLQEAIKHRGSSLADEQYRDLFGEVGDFQNQHKVYDREGEPCRRCRSPIVRIKQGGRSTFLCEQCQV
jgi:formamidopyrimidine-DNA glycosylase